MSIDDKEKLSLLEDLNSIRKALIQAEFKLKRTLVDKDIVTNLLEQNVDELKKKNDIIEDQIASKEQILANVNHELRTPLNAIIGMSDLLQKTPLNDQQKKYTDLIKRSGDNLFIIINDFLTISSMKAGKLHLKEQAFTLSEVCEDLYDIFSIQTNLGDVKLLFETDDIINETYLGDPTRIHQIFQNLLNNAIKFTSEGSVKFSCKIKEDLGKTKVIRFLIEDTGVGIPTDMQANIFDSFTQAFTASEKGYSGTGLGLNIVQHLVHLMKGTISVESQVDIGTIFTVEIPFEHIQTKTIKKEDPTNQLEIPAEWASYRTLMIEDNKANIFYAHELFKRWNLNIVFAETFKEGLNAAKAEEYDLILCDVNLPDGNGLDLIKEIRVDKSAKSCQTKIAVITASILQSNKDKAAELDIIGYIEKPFTASTLLRELHRIFDQGDKNLDADINSSNNLSEQELVEKLNVISTDPNVHLKFLDIFLNQFKEDMNVLSDGVKRVEYETIYSIAHKLKSSVKFFDSDMFHHVSLLENYGLKKESMDLVNDEYQHLIKRSEILIPALENMAKDLSISLK